MCYSVYRTAGTAKKGNNKGGAYIERNVYIRSHSRNICGHFGVGCAYHQPDNQEFPEMGPHHALGACCRQYCLPMAISAAGYHGAQSSDMQADVPAGIIDAAPKVIVDMDTADDGEYIFFTPHRECADGRWIAKGHTYKYRLEFTGRLGSAACDTTYLVLSNTKDITFRQAMLASGLGSRTDDYFDIDYALIVGIK